MKGGTGLRLAGVQERTLRYILFPGDGCEAVAFALCGRHSGAQQDILLVESIHAVPQSDYVLREPDRVTWRTQFLEPLLARAEAERLAVVKFHSHPTGIAHFSPTDDAADTDLFASIYGWADDAGPHASVVMLPDGSMFGRTIDEHGRLLPLERITVAGESIKIFGLRASVLPAYAERHEQLFGAGTTNLLRQLRIGVVGCSGTGGFVIEMLARLGVQHLVLVDPDCVEYRNLNRIVGTRATDAALRRSKVDVLAEHVSGIGLGTEVTGVCNVVASREAVLALAGCDVVFGCMDSHDGRRTLNRLAAFYVLPYFDCGVGLEADGNGGVDQVCAASHYVQPGASTVLGRRIVNQKRADAEAMARVDPKQYATLRREKYIEGVDVDRPAVISVNGLAAALVVNEFLARLHQYRDEADDHYASVRLSLSQMYLYTDRESYGSPLARALGHGDVEPLLDMPQLSA